jgi:hypothetical protein
LILEELFFILSFIHDGHPEGRDSELRNSSVGGGARRRAAMAVAGQARLSVWWLPVWTSGHKHMYCNTLLLALERHIECILSLKKIQ